MISYTPTPGNYIESPGMMYLNSGLMLPWEIESVSGCLMVMVGQETLVKYLLTLLFPSACTLRRRGESQMSVSCQASGL